MEVETRLLGADGTKGGQEDGGQKGRRELTKPILSENAIMKLDAFHTDC